MGIGHLHPDSDGEGFGSHGDLHAKAATYALFKAWLLAVEDWVLSHTHTMPDNLGLVTVWVVAHLTMSLDVYSWLETCGALGMM